MPADPASFLQSPEWQEIQERMGRPTRRIGSLLLIRHDLPFGYHYWYAPQPALNDAATFFRALEHAGRSGAIFLKVDPAEGLPAVSVRHVPSHALQPRVTLVFDCRRDEAECAAALHPKTRYNIRLAEKRGVAVRLAWPPVSGQDIAAFHRLLSDTAKRDGFRVHPARHYQTLLAVSSGAFVNRLFMAEVGGVPVGAAIVNFYRPAATATYLHGASSYEHRACMAPHLLHWRIIREARERGCTAYDFGGIDDEKWPGLTRFKRGFGGEERRRPPSVDFVFQPAHYILYRLQHWIRHSQ